MSNSSSLVTSTSTSSIPTSTLESLISLDQLTFSFEEYVIKEFGVSLSFQKAPLCRNYVRGFCPLGDQCPSRHPTKGKTVVCKHWLRGLCKKGDTCEFLHEYNLRKMPECWFFSKYKECSNAECIYLHIDPATKIKPCPWYARGFCKRGPECNHKHIKKPLCLLYMTGFCPRGSECPDGHPKFEPLDLDEKEFQERDRDLAAPRRPGGMMSSHPSKKKLDNIVCFRCGNKGHYANQCPQP